MSIKKSRRKKRKRRSIPPKSRNISKRNPLSPIQSLSNLRKEADNAVRDFFNAASPKGQRLSLSAQVTRLTELNNVEDTFGVTAVAQNYLISLCGFSGELSPVNALLPIALGGFSYEDFNDPEKNYNSGVSRSQINKIKKYVFFAVEERSSLDFKEKTKITVDFNEDTCTKLFTQGTDFPEWFPDILKEQYGQSPIEVIVVNKNNNPAAYSQYLKLKQAVFDLNKQSEWMFGLLDF